MITIVRDIDVFMYDDMKKIFEDRNNSSEYKKRAFKRRIVEFIKSLDRLFVWEGDYYNNGREYHG